MKFDIEKIASAIAAATVREVMKYAEEEKVEETEKKVETPKVEPEKTAQAASLEKLLKGASVLTEKHIKK